MTTSARLGAGMESLLLFRRALSSPTMSRFIPALSLTPFPMVGPRRTHYLFS